MTERRESGEAEPTTAREFERGDRVLGRCVVDRCVRRDRLASFYSARATEDDAAETPCTVWSVHAGIVHRSERAATVFFDEMQAASTVSHPSIPAVIAFDPAAPGPVVIAHAAAGTSLRDRLAEGELLNTREVARIISAVGDALTTLHRASPPVFHRAVTPERVITADDIVALEECGYAHALVHSGLLSEREVESFAQPGYRVPSHVSRGGGAAVDGFMLAVLAFEALTGQLPFGAATTAELDEATRGASPSARAARPTLPAEVDAVFARAWAQGGDRAYADPSAFASELARILAPNEGEWARDANQDEGDRLFTRPSQRPGDDEVDRALGAIGAATASEESAPAKRIDVERLLPMVSAALQVGERNAAVSPERRSGKSLPPLSRALDLPPSKPTLLGAATGSARGVAPFSVRPVAPAKRVDDEPRVEDPTPVVGYEHIGAASLREGRESVPETSESRPPDLSDDAELQERLSLVNPPVQDVPAERSVVELDVDLLEPSTTNSNLQRIMDEIATFRPSERSPVLESDAGAHLADSLDEGVTRAVNREDLVRDELAEARASELSERVPPSTPMPGTLRPPGPALHGTISKKTPLPPLPPYESVSSRGTPLSSIKPVAGARPSTRTPGDPGDGSGPRLGTPVQTPGKASSLPTTTPPPTRLNTPVPLASPSGRPVRRSVPPGAVTKPAASAPPIDDAPRSEPVSPVRDTDPIARVAPTVARLTALAALIATVGLIYAARQLDAYMSDPAFAHRDPVRPEVTPPLAAADAAPAVDDLATATAPPSIEDATVASTPPPAEAGASTDLPAATPGADVVDAVADVATSASSTVASSTVAPVDAGAPRRVNANPAGVPGDAVHARVWSQLSRRVADCVEGIDSHTSVTVFVRFDGATGMVQRIRSRGIFAEPPVGPCLEAAVTGIRVAPFAAPSWDTTFSFPIAPPRWRPPQ